MPKGQGTVEISVVCAVGHGAGDLVSLHQEFREVLAREGRTAEFIYVLDGPRPAEADRLTQIRDELFAVRVLRMARGFGEATALQVGFARAVGTYVLTIPSRPQIEPTVVHDVLACLDRGDPVVVTRRDPRIDPLFNRLQAQFFNWIVQTLVRQRFHDMTCAVRGFTSEAARKLDLYGDQHRFIPVIAARCGYLVVEISGRQHPEARALRIFGPGEYLRRVLDVLNIYFLARFTRKPLRFFGLIGLAIGFMGFAITTYLTVQRLSGMTALAGRPLLLLGVLLIVLGVQVTSIGLLGELILFLCARQEMPEAVEVPREVGVALAAETTSRGGRA